MKPLILKYKEHEPVIDPTVKIAPNATITGDVVIGAHSSIWFNTVIRGDVMKIILGSYVNIQDGAIIHSTRGRNNTVIGDHTSVGHGAILHGCTTEGSCLIGMGAIILDDALIRKNVIIGANTLVPQNMICESGFIYAGTPAQKLKPIDEKSAAFYIEETSKAYVKYSGEYPEFDLWKNK